MDTKLFGASGLRTRDMPLLARIEETFSEFLLPKRKPSWLNRLRWLARDPKVTNLRGYVVNFSFTALSRPRGEIHHEATEDTGRWGTPGLRARDMPFVLIIEETSSKFLRPATERFVVELVAMPDGSLEKYRTSKAKRRASPPANSECSGIVTLDCGLAAIC